MVVIPNIMQPPTVYYNIIIIYYTHIYIYIYFYRKETVDYRRKSYTHVTYSKPRYTNIIYI